MTQYARPDSVITNQDSAWSPSTGTIPECIDEETPSGSDYIYCSTAAKLLDVGLSEVTDPVSSSDHWIKWMWEASGTAGKEYCSVGLYCDGSLIALWDNQEVPRAGETRQQELSSAQADDIDDYSALSFRASIASIGSGEEIHIQWVEFSCPDAGAAGGGAKNMQLMGVG